MSDKVSFILCGYEMIQEDNMTLHEKAMNAPFLSGIETLFENFDQEEGKQIKLPSGKELPGIKLRLSIRFFGFDENGESELPVFSDIKNHFRGDLSVQKITPYLVFLKNVNSDEDLDGYNILDPSNHSDDPRECIVRQISGNVVYCFYYLGPPTPLQILAFAKGLHKRLGEFSPLNYLPEENIFIKIVSHINTRNASFINKGYDHIRKCCATVTTLTGDRLLTVADREMTNRQIYAKTRQGLERVGLAYLNKFILVMAGREIPRDDNLFQIPRSGSHSISIIIKRPREGQGSEHLESAEILREDGIIPNRDLQAANPDDALVGKPSEVSEEERMFALYQGGGKKKSKKKSKRKSKKRKSKRRKSTRKSKRLKSKRRKRR